MYVFVAATARSSPASSGSTTSASLRERRVDRVRQRERRPSLPARLREHRDDVGRRARLRDADARRRRRAAAAARRSCRATASRTSPARGARGRAGTARSAPRSTSSRATRSGRSGRRRARRASRPRAPRRPAARAAARAPPAARAAQSQATTRASTPAQRTRLDLEPVVEDDDVCGGARLEHAEVGAADDPRGHGRRGADRVLERDAERVQVAHGVDHRQHRAGEDAVLRASARRRADLDRRRRRAGMCRRSTPCPPARSRR